MAIIENWDSYTRQGLDIASSAVALGFTAAKAGTRLGFSVTRGIASTATKVTSTVVDHTLFGGNQVTAPVITQAVASVITLAEQITLAPIFLGEYVVGTSLSVVQSSVNALSIFFPGSHEASFSIVACIALLRDEWNYVDERGEHLPSSQFSVAQMVKGVIAWVSLQSVTQEWEERRLLKYMKEIHVREPPRSIESLRARRGSRVRVTSDIIFPGDDRAQIIAADIGEAPARSKSMFFHPKPSRTKLIPTQFLEPRRMSNTNLKATLRRLSKMVLYGYGGASLLFFGVPLTAGPPPAGSPQAKSEEAQLANAINASELEASGDLSEREMPDLPEEYSWWDVLLGKHDHEIFAAFSTDKAMKGTDVIIGQEHLMPRYWVLTDHGRSQIVLVIRGTMSLNEIAVDLTCMPVDFKPARATPLEETPLPGQYAFPTGDEAPANDETPTYQVHDGMYRMAKAMGDIGRPVQVTVQQALHENPEYELVICGHSLGAGVAALLGLIWADPKTCRTVKSSGLPVGRRVSVYSFAPPCTTDVPLAKLAENLVVSFIYSHDLVSRLSIGTMMDLRNAALNLCMAEASGNGDKQCGHSAVLERAGKWKSGFGSPEDENWFIAMRKTLEASMSQPTKLYVPGRVWWALRDSDLCPVHRSEETTSGPDRLRLFEVLDIEKAFSQMVFAKDMLSSHFPHKYDNVLHDLL